MPRPSAAFGISGDVIEDEGKREMMIREVEMIEREFFTVGWTGGGKQINRMFEANGWPIKFGPFGRECETLEQRRACRNILEENRDFLQDIFDTRGISVRLEIPFDDESSVLCPANVDLKLCQVYLGYDKLFRFTLEERVAKKEAMFREVARAFNLGQGDPLNKIKVIGL